MLTLSNGVKANGVKMVKTLSAALCFSFSLGFSLAAQPVLAQSAPVYDVDSMQDGAASSASPQAQQDVYPPAPDQDGSAGQDGGSGFVPMQQSSALAPAAQSNVASKASASSQSKTPTTSSTSSTSSNPEQRMQHLEQQINNMQSNDGGARVESLQNQVQALRSQVEQLSHKMEQLQNQQKALFNHMIHDEAASPQLSSDAALNAGSSTGSNTGADNVQAGAQAANANPSATELKTLTKPLADAKALPAKPVNAQPNVAEEQEIYQTAYNLIKAKKYEEAVNTLQGMLKKYPSGQFASNAHYWLGELYGLMSNNDKALTEFATVVETYPDSPRVPDAQLKVGLLYASQSKWSEAKAALKKVINRYPGSTPAKLAMEQLKQIKLAGH
jgi:tol-pal system protein YbgF